MDVWMGNPISLNNYLNKINSLTIGVGWGIYALDKNNLFYRSNTDKGAMCKIDPYENIQ